MKQIEREVGEYLWYCEKVRKMSGDTMVQKRNVLGRFVAATGAERLSEVTNKVLNDWVAYEMERGIRVTSMNTYNAVVMAMIRYFREFGVMIPVNLALMGKVRAERSPRKFYTAEEIERVIMLADSETGLMIRIMFETGMRIAELARLRLAEFQGRRIRFVGKGKKLREVYVREDTLQMIEEFVRVRGVQDYLWGLYGYGANGEPPTTVTIRKRLRRVFDAAGFVGFYPHALRHSFATDLQKRGASVEEIKEMIGHSSVATTERYLHGFEGRLEELFDKYR